MLWEHMRFLRARSLFVDNESQLAESRTGSSSQTGIAENFTCKTL